MRLSVQILAIIVLTFALIGSCKKSADKSSSSVNYNQIDSVIGVYYGTTHYQEYETGPVAKVLMDTTYPDTFTIVKVSSDSFIYQSPNWGEGGFLYNISDSFEDEADVHTLPIAETTLIKFFPKEDSMVFNWFNPSPFPSFDGTAQYTFLGKKIR